MSARGLNELVGRACISETFMRGLMNGQRAELIRSPEFDLGNVAEQMTQLQNSKIFTADNVERLTDGKCLRTYPGVHPCDGFFAALLQRK